METTTKSLSVYYNIRSKKSRQGLAVEKYDYMKKILIIILFFIIFTQKI